MAVRKYKDKVVVKQRMLVIFGVLFVLFFAMVIRLFYIMITKSEEYKNIANEQWTSEVKISAKRGRILDKNGTELAISGNVYRIDLDLNALRKEWENKDSKKTIQNEQETADNLATALGMNVADIIKIFDKTLPNGNKMGSANLKRRVQDADAAKVRALNIQGVLISGDTQRYYVDGNLLSQTLGHTNIDGDGLTGLEKQYDKVLSGTPGVRYVEADNQGLNYTISKFTKPSDGKDLITTIDEAIQLICEKQANQALKDTKAKAVTVIAMDPKTGEVLALVNKPDYNPNDPWAGNLTSDQLQKEWRNRAVSDTFEPGSVFKVVTATAAMQENKVTPADRFDCLGSLKVANRVIHCWKTTGHGSEDFLDILKNSCNVGFMTLGARLGADTLNQYIAKFGFGQKTGIDLPGEAVGIIKKKNVSATDLATISFGQTDTVSCIQYLAGFNVIANNGKWVEPHLMKSIVQYDDSDKLIYKKDFAPVGDRQAIDPTVAKTLSGYLEQVVENGGGRNAFIDGYHIAGKTGTAQKIDPVNGGYAAQKYISSFAGMAPANDPKITLFVSIDEPDPSNYYAGQITAPVAKRIFNDIFNYLALKVDASSEDIAKSMLRNIIIPEVRGKTKNEAVDILKKAGLTSEIDATAAGDNIVDMNPKPGYTAKEGDKIILYSGTQAVSNNIIIVPDLTGYGNEKVNEILTSIGLKAEFIGDGIVSEQSIPSGEQISKGSSITVRMTTLGD